MQEQGYFSPTTAAYTDGGTFFLRTDQIRTQNSKHHAAKSPNSIIRLAGSIKKYGILEPLTVRPLLTALGAPPLYELVAGEQRYRAAILIGIEKVPCVLATESDQNREISRLLSQAADTNADFFAQAAAFRALAKDLSLTQEQIARKAGISQSAVANKLRLLHFTYEEQHLILSAGLTERHARAILRLPDPAIRIQVIRHIKAERLNVAKTEQLVEELSSNSAQTAKKPPVAQESASALSPPVLITPRQPNGFCPNKLAIADLTPLYNSIERVLSIFRKTGATASCTTEEGTNGAKITIDISK